jgi:hypothetical protein
VLDDVWWRGNIHRSLPHSTSISAGQDIAGAVASERHSLAGLAVAAQVAIASKV